MSNLTTTESGRLAECEQVIREKLADFIEVGNALTEINQDRLYRATHKTFADYCRDRWDMGKSHAYRLIAAAREDRQEMSPTGDKPKNEREARNRREPAESKPKPDPVGHEPFHGPPITVEARQPGEDEKPRKNGSEKWPVKDRTKAAKVLGDLIRLIPRDSDEGRKAQPHLDALVLIVEGK